MDDGSLIYKTTPYGFTPKGKSKITIPVQSEDKETAARIIQHLRPWRHGAKLDSTGGDPLVWVLRAIFNPTVEEGGDDEATLANFPDRVIELENCVRNYETGDFVHPIDGVHRARIWKVSRSMSEDEVDTARATIVVVEDNEENVDARAISPSIRGAAVKLAETTSFSAQLEGDGWNSAFEDLKEFSAELQGLMRAPGRAADDLDAKVRGVVRAADAALATLFEVQRKDTKRATSGPSPSSRNALERLLDTSYGANDEQQANRPRARVYRVNRTTTIYAIASDVRQPVPALLELNAQRIEDPNVVEPGSYRVFERWP